MQYVVRLAILIVPAVYLWTGIAPLYFTGVEDILFYQAPVLLAYFLLMVWITPSRYLPIVSSAVGAFATFRMLPTVISSVVRPFGKPFKVTPKGSGNEDNAFDGYTFACVSSLIAATALGLFVNVVPEWSQIGEGEFSVVSAYWALMNIAVLVIAALICFEKAKPLQDSFDTDETAHVSVDGQRTAARLRSISLDGAVLEWPAGATPPMGDILVELSGVEPFRARNAAGPAGRSTGVSRTIADFKLEGPTRDQMIVKLYTGAYSQDVRELDKSAIAGGILARAFGPSRAR